MDIKNFSTMKFTFCLSRLFNLLSILLIVLIYSCNKHNKNIVQDQQAKIDTLQISVKLPPRRSAGFNMINSKGAYYVRFVNNGTNDSVIIKKIAMHYNRQVIMYSGGVVKDGKYNRYVHNYLIDKKINHLEFEYKKGDIILKNNMENIVVDDLYNDYEALVEIIFKANENEKVTIKGKLDSLYFFYQNKYSNRNDLAELNKLHYLDKLQRLYPNDKSIDSFLKHLNVPPIACDIALFIAYKYVENNIATFNFNEINSRNYSKEYISLLSIGMFNFLNYEDNRGDKRYEPALQWLKSTDFYSSNKIFVDKNLTPINNAQFKNRLSKLILLDKEFSPVNFSDVIIKNQSDYYLLDFWATWCKPCLEGMQRIQKMDIPPNVKVINLSTDKPNGKDAWKKNTVETGLNINYLIDLSIDANIDFLKYIELTSIPRYILIDKNMNIVDEAFFHPHEPEFQNILSNIASFYGK